MRRLVSGMGLAKVLLITKVLLIASVLFISGCFDQSSEHSGIAEPKLKQTITPFLNPESVLFDKDKKQFYVSQANFSVNEGGGKIALLDDKGVVQKADWITGLNHPKGLARNGNKLYVTDVTELVEIDISGAKIVKKYPLEGALFLNDPIVAEDGTVYVADTLTNSISRLSNDGTYQVWLKDKKLANPNGLLIVGDYLYVTGWGQTDGTTVDALMKAPMNGRLMRVNMATKAIEVLGSEPLGHLDGIEADGKGNFFVTDWTGGQLFHLSQSGATLAKYDLAKVFGIESAKGLADIEFLEDKQEIWAPMMLKGSIEVLSVASPRGSN